jgi:Na+-translocating ferredoxin:NAD+ oxidoreductase RNF subunit RnfB
VVRCRECGVWFCGCDRYQPEIAWETELCRKCLPGAILQWARLRRIGFEIEEETIA